MRDLPRVADLVETCFAGTMDNEGQRFIQQMRKAGEDHHWLQWAANAVESASLPLSGYVWEEGNALVGNVSLIPYREKGKKVYLLANVAVLPEFRRRGIAQALTQQALEHIWKHNATAAWLHVRNDNPGAVQLYSDLGFREVVRRSHWQAQPDRNIPEGLNNLHTRQRIARDWGFQQKWLERLYPEAMRWYQVIPWEGIRPGLTGAVQRFFMEINSQSWSICDQENVLGMVTAISSLGRSPQLWVAIPENHQDEALTALLIHARRNPAGHEHLVADFPGGLAEDAFKNAGFICQRTLIWMKLEKTFSKE